MQDEHDEFVATLESFKDLKSGISGSRIKKLTSYALDHVSEEPKLMQLVIDYSKSSPDTHKLGSLYIIDSIGRAYLEQARARDDYIKASAKEGSCAHGVYTLGEAIQELLSDAISKSNSDHKDKIRTLIDIWDRSGLFQKGYLNAVRARWFSMGDNPSGAPPGSSNQPVLSQDPATRCVEILQNLRPAANVPQVAVPADLISTDVAAQQSALFRLLSDLQQHQAAFRAPPPQQVAPARQNHVVESNIQQPAQASRQDRRERYSTSSRRARSRSPPRRENHRSSEGPNASNNHHLYPGEENVPSNNHFRPKPVSVDPTIPPEHIKVFSRTLFVGGVPPSMKEYDIAHVLRPYGEVQSVILNSSRKHAFVKVYSRQEAENVLNNFNKDGSSPLRTRWGVGFGPRDCCDYQHGYSVIPLHRLTDADKKWTTSAEWGGTGGQPLQPYMAFEEPDIVVGEGVSSKAISQKMPTDSGRNGPKSGKPVRNPPFRQSPGQNQFYGQMATAPIPAPIQAPNQYPPAGYGASPPIQSYGMQPAMAVQPVPAMYGGMQQQAAPPQQSQFDPTAQLNSLMSMLNQQK
ncbi:Protein NRD1 [Lachancea thermotolerans]|uniref:KLTH0F02992p n=1 Tax=Lachancea thermotolerans (strain ATCC 56472 / CBS 6340 / NRRL Y-8284) TaxID=559295 RepID=C5DKA3_LACTC|nr:KLTH0F02992p [Lachancea thermotolerans CBS 6340]CAR23904.1 KLTH0F02992p [Lachancea thermotolerans CBS 6340]